MAKHKKHKKKSAAAAPSEGAVKAQLKSFNWKRLLLIIFTTALAFSVYEALILLNFLPIGDIPIIMPVYFIIVTVLLCTILILNSGISTKPVTPDMIRLNEDEDDEYLRAVCDRLNARKATAKKLMLILLPFVFAILFDVLYLFYGDLLTGVISSLGGK